MPAFPDKGWKIDEEGFENGSSSDYSDSDFHHSGLSDNDSNSFSGTFASSSDSGITTRTKNDTLESVSFGRLWTH